MSAAAPIRILSLTYAEDSYVNAQQVNAREIAARLDPLKFEMTLLSDGSGPAQIERSPPVRLVHIGRHGRAMRLLLALLFRRFDILFYAGPGLPESVFVRLPRLWPSRRRSRLLLPVEGDVSQLDEVPAWIRHRVDRLHREADALFPITEHVAAGLHARTGRGGEVVPVGVDLAAFSPRGTERRPGPLRVLSVGTVKTWKRPELARAAAKAFPAASFTWVGEGESRTPESERAPPNLDFSGPLSREALPDAYRDADVFLHPSRMEGLPKVLLEALACGLPIVAFDDYRPRFLTEGGAGIVVRSEAEMLDALRRLLDDAALRQRMGEAARALAAHYSWDVIAARWETIFEREANLSRRSGLRARDRSEPGRPPRTSNRLSAEPFRNRPGRD